MLPFLTLIKTFFTAVIKNWGAIASVIMLVFIFLFFEQCKSTKAAKVETEMAKVIAENNRKALTDSTIVLKMTRDQLATTDKTLSDMVKKLDSLEKHPEVIYIAKPIYMGKDVVADNKLIHDSTDKTRYGLEYSSVDSVRTIEAISWFRAVNTPKTLEIIPENTIIKNFAINFGLSISQYDDKEEQVTRLLIEPYYVDANGNYTKPISKNLLDINYRGVNLLTVPYKESPKNIDPPKSKYSIRSGFSLSFNFLSYGYLPNSRPAEFNFAMPTVGIGYSLVFVRNM